MDLELSGQVAAVTSAGRGIRSAFVRAPAVESGPRTARRDRR
jgi:hypothetical protein